MELPLPAESTNPDSYKSFDELCKQVHNLNVPPNWRVSFGNTLHIFRKGKIHEILVFNVYFSNNINFLIRVFV